MRPRCCLRYLTFFGINIGLLSLAFLLRNRRRHRGQNRSLHRSAFPRRRNRSCSRRPRSAIPVSVTVAALARRSPPGLRFIAQSAPLPARKNLALIDPALDPDHAISRVGLAESVIDIRAQRVQRKLALQIPLGARDFGAVQSPRNADLDSFASEAQ